MSTKEPQRLIKTRGLGLELGGQRILHDIDMDIVTSEIVTIIGPNGAGKSSLLKVIAGLYLPSVGTLSRAQELQLSYVPQKLHIDQNLPIKVSRFLSLGNDNKALYREALQRVDAAHLWSKQMTSLSGGELQRVLLARAISRSPNLLLLDEPLQGVDVTGQTQLYQLIANIRDELNCAIVMVSHDLHLVMAQTDKVLCLNHHVCCQGQPESVSQHPEYLNLFGPRAAQNLAVYTHHHDHHHELHGDIVHCSTECKHD